VDDQGGLGDLVEPIGGVERLDGGGVGLEDFPGRVLCAPPPDDPVDRVGVCVDERPGDAGRHRPFERVGVVGVGPQRIEVEAVAARGRPDQGQALDPRGRLRRPQRHHPPEPRADDVGGVDPGVGEDGLEVRGEGVDADPVAAAGAAGAPEVGHQAPVGAGDRGVLPPPLPRAVPRVADERDRLARPVGLVVYLGAVGGDSRHTGRRPPARLYHPPGVTGPGG